MASTEHSTLETIAHHPDVFFHILHLLPLQDLPKIAAVSHALLAASPFSDPDLPFWQSALQDRAPGALALRLFCRKGSSDSFTLQKDIQKQGQEPWMHLLRRVLSLNFTLPRTSPAPEGWASSGLRSAAFDEVRFGLLVLAASALQLPRPPSEGSTYAAKTLAELSGDNLADAICWTYSVVHGITVHQYENQAALSQLFMDLVSHQVVKILANLLRELPPLPGKNNTSCCEAAQLLADAVLERLLAVGTSFSAALSYLDLFYACRTSAAPILTIFLERLIHELPSLRPSTQTANSLLQPDESRVSCLAFLQLVMAATRDTYKSYRHIVGEPACYTLSYGCEAFSLAFKEATNKVIAHLYGPPAGTGEPAPVGASPEAAGPASRPETGVRRSSNGDRRGGPAVNLEAPAGDAEIRVWAPRLEKHLRGYLSAPCVHESAILFRTSEALAAMHKLSGHPLPLGPASWESFLKKAAPRNSSKSNLEALPSITVQVNFKPLSANPALHTFTTYLTRRVMPLDAYDAGPSLLALAPTPDRPELLHPGAEPRRRSLDLPRLDEPRRRSLDLPRPDPPDLGPRIAAAVMPVEAVELPGLLEGLLSLRSRASRVESSEGASTSVASGTPYEDARARRGVGSSSRRRESALEEGEVWEPSGYVGVALNYFGVERLVRRDSRVLSNTGERRGRRRSLGPFDPALRVIWGVEADLEEGL